MLKQGPQDDKEYKNVTKLPDSWRWISLGEVCQQDRRVIDASSEKAKKLLYLSLEHIESQTGQILRNPESPLEDEGKSTTFAFDSRHILYGKLRPYLNKVALPNFEGRCTTEAIPLIPNSRTDRHFVAWILRRKETVDAAMRGKTGSRMPRANMEVLLNIEIPLPPVVEQKRIAAILNDHMSEAERLRKSVDEQLNTIKSLPAALLRQAFSGEL